MAGKIQYAVSVTPIATVAAGTDYAEHEVIEKSVGGTIGGSDTLAVTNNIDVEGYGSNAVGNPDYGNCPASGQLELGTANVAYSMVFIKHTGNQFSSATALGSESTATNKLQVLVEYTNGSTAIVCELLPGGAVALPNTIAHGANTKWQVQSSASESVAVEYAMMKTS